MTAQYTPSVAVLFQLVESNNFPKNNISCQTVAACYIFAIEQMQSNRMEIIDFMPNVELHML